MGFATNIKAERIEVFAKTLRQIYRPDECDVVVYTNAAPQDVAAVAERYAVELVYTANNYGPTLGKVSKLLSRAIVYSTKTLAAASRPIAALGPVFGDLYPALLKLWHHPHFVRWFCYQEFLRVHREYDKVLLSDVKDVAFQATFFDFFQVPKLLFFEQDQEYDGENIDSQWYRAAYGEAEFEKVKGSPSLCIGTVLGDRDSIESFVDRIVAEILRRPYGRIEQTVLNKLHHSDGFQGLPVQAVKNAVGPVLTLSCYYTESLFALEPRGLRGNDGRIVPIIHMYDRIPRTLAHFSGIVGYPLEPTVWKG